MLYGYAGTILRVDLGKGSVKRDPLPPALAEKYIGGRGFVARLLYNELPTQADPLGKDNMVVVATGPLSGHFLPSNGKTHFGTKSPATGGYADSNMGGHFGPALKYAGYDMLVLTGKTATPSYLFIEDEIVEIRPADEHWGLGAITTEVKLKQALGADFQIITIGPAAENQVKFACISHDFGRQAGRTGVGAVLGSKNLKAVAVKGTGGIPVFDVEGVYKEGKEAFKAVFDKPGFKGWTPEGTAGITNWVNEVGVFPSRNFQTSYADHYRQINGRAILDKLKITDKGCSCCPTPCGKYGHTNTRLGAAHVEGPEYETIAMFGGCCLLPSIEEIAYANYLCDEWGIDTISAGAVIGWAVECYEKALISKEQMGREVRFSDLETVVYLLEKIGKREGIGDLLAEGVRAASQTVGKGSDQFAIHVKGLEWSGYECRNAPGMMLAYMTADVGAHHSRAWVLGHDVAGSDADVHELITSGGLGDRLPKSSVAGKAAKVIESQTIRPLFDILGICRLQFMELGLEVNHYEEIFHLVTGRKKTWEDLLAVSDMIWHLTRAFSVREIERFERSHDYPPPRLYREPIPTGPNEGHYIRESELEILLDDYYQRRGWDKNGIPTRETLERVGLRDMAADMDKNRL